MSEDLKMKRFKCVGPKCNGRSFESPAKCRCSNCASGKHVYEESTIHFLIEDDNGPVEGQNARYRVACKAARPTQNSNSGWSGEKQAVNCPDCLSAIREIEERDKSK